MRFSRRWKVVGVARAVCAAGRPVALTVSLAEGFLLRLLFGTWYDHLRPNVSGR